MPTDSQVFLLGRVNQPQTRENQSNASAGFQCAGDLKFLRDSGKRKGPNIPSHPRYAIVCFMIGHSSGIPGIRSDPIRWGEEIGNRFLSLSLL